MADIVLFVEKDTSISENTRIKYILIYKLMFNTRMRMDTEETWDYCFDGIPKGSTVVIGTVSSWLRKKDNRRLFEEGFRKMIATLQPKTIIIYGSENYAII